MDLFNRFFALFSVFLAISTDTILHDAEKVGTASNQVILGGLVIILICVVIYRERQQNKANKSASDNLVELTLRLDRDRDAFDEERRQRIGSLMQLVRDNTIALQQTASAELSVKTAVDANTRVTEALINNIRVRSDETK